MGSFFLLDKSREEEEICSRLAGAKKGLGKKRGENQLKQKIQKWAFGGAMTLTRIGLESSVYRRLSAAMAFAIRPAPQLSGLPIVPFTTGPFLDPLRMRCVRSKRPEHGLSRPYISLQQERNSS